MGMFSGNPVRPIKSRGNPNDCKVTMRPTKGGGKSITISGNCTPAQVAAAKELASERSQGRETEIENNSEEY